MDQESGQLSIDFIIGFGIFMIAFVFVAVLVSGFLVSLQSKTIDYDAVAYRTSVILVEDPGWSSLQGTRWESESSLSNIVRIGLAFSKDYPNILSIDKVKQFFYNNLTLFNGPDDYRDKLLLNKSGQYPYHFSINLSGYPPVEYSIPPKNSGYIKRVVLIREPPSDYISINDSVQYVNVSINFTSLQNHERGEPYMIYPYDENITILLNNTNASNPLQLLSLDLTTSSGQPISLSYQKTLIDNVEPSFKWPQISQNLTQILRANYSDNTTLQQDCVLVFKFNGTQFNITSNELQPSFTAANLTVRIW